jgi:thiamine pyrophosphate-dependent acetolactate synthase large subunit-like protein
VPAQRIVDPSEVGPALQRAMSSGGPALLDVSVADGFGG